MLAFLFLVLIVGEEDAKGDTPLVFATRVGFVEAVARLLEAGEAHCLAVLLATDLNRPDTGRPERLFQLLLHLRVGHGGHRVDMLADLASDLDASSRAQPESLAKAALQIDIAVSLPLLLLTTLHVGHHGFVHHGRLPIVVALDVDAWSAIAARLSSAVLERRGPRLLS